ncbi:hypothetical protein FSP39_020851 [Pinctada imbricata]|uniref:NADAR domain-containing protein n=1 Tax=Pinctada imbricata TaxID=66713 RepID=A0AA88Y7D0_PINIB|nr:hypothetical protein FSP39_020851 [Pinctada imbricata]
MQSEEKDDAIHFFYGQNNPFSQWYRCYFYVDGVKYNCAEQYMMHQKALLFGDEDVAEEIMMVQTPYMQKRLGRGVRHFRQDKWDKECYKIVTKGNTEKFKQNPHLLKELLATHPKTLAETNPYDCIWGIGLGSWDDRIHDKMLWRGENRLGYILTEIRNREM